ncbi:hypothetical protein INT44_002654 [Umbelopsis vinacea]|uniref:Uncharacterized protein n=1 Tax=Umbelopsis vinacea TaxID=44442 RepID=A0A8H7PFD1_9FUNG|nr:hypothetical protein INT44_002654 [Umbelopsis vinacea]
MADIIVGADSLHSSIRQSTIGDKFEELTIMNLSGLTDITAEQYKALPNINAGLHELAQEIACAVYVRSKLECKWQSCFDRRCAMALYRGEGLNHAMIDVAKLGEQLVKAHRDEITLAEVIAAYEIEAIPRGNRAVKASYESAYQLHEGFTWLVTRITNLFGLTFIIANVVSAS